MNVATRRWLAGALLSTPLTCAAEGLSIADSVRAALRDDPLIARQTARVRASLGLRREASGAFATRLSSSLGLAHDRQPLTILQRSQFPGVDQTITDSSFYTVAAERPLRNGANVRLDLSVERTRLGAGGDAQALALLPELPPDNLARLSLTATQPLLKGFGAQAAAAGENSAELIEQAELLNLLHVSSERALAAATAYWNYAAAQAALGIAQASEARAQTLLEQTGALVKAERRPAADLNQLRADAADRAAQRIGAQQALYAARLDLGRAMGLSAEDSEALPPAADALPEPTRVSVPQDLSAAGLAGHALRQRRDLRAAALLTAAARLRLRASELNLRQRLDLIGSVGYTGLDSGSSRDRYFSALGENVNGANYAVQLRYEYPFGNEAAEGQRLQQTAAYEERLIAEHHLARSIGTDIAIAVQELAASRAALTASHAAVDEHRRALAAEATRFRHGASTLFTQQQFQDRLNLAQAAAVAAQARLAVALVRLRHQTGTLLRPDAEDLAPAAADFFTLPSSESGEPFASPPGRGRHEVRVRAPWREQTAAHDERPSPLPLSRWERGGSAPIQGYGSNIVGQAQGSSHD